MSKELKYVRVFKDQTKFKASIFIWCEFLQINKLATQTLQNIINKEAKVLAISLSNGKYI